VVRPGAGHPGRHLHAFTDGNAVPKDVLIGLMAALSEEKGKRD